MKKSRACILSVMTLVIIAANVEGVTAKQIKLFFIVPNDNGKAGRKIGCDDSLVPVNVDIARTPTPLRGAYEALLAIHDDPYGTQQYANPLSRSDLKLKSAAIRKKTALIHLTGNLVSAGHCEAPRIEAQLTAVALQFPSVKRVSVFVNGVALRKLLSEQ